MGIINEQLANRISEIQGRILISANKSGRQANDIKLVAATKGRDIETIQAAYSLGIKDFGESRAQELCPKYEILKEASWHFIGRLQTNKVKYIIDKVVLIHSLDSIRLAQEIDFQAKKRGKVQNLLVEVNVSGELSKTGIETNMCESFLREIALLKNIKVNGLMTIVPYVNEKQKIRGYFGKMYKLFIDIAMKEIHNINMEYLSAGMTNDFEIAIEEGVNLVRIGTGIFGVKE